jgi:hypothetical protein
MLPSHAQALLDFDDDGYVYLEDVTQVGGWGGWGRLHACMHEHGLRASPGGVEGRLRVAPCASPFLANTFSMGYVCLNRFL